MKTTLVIFSGLPGTGKSTLATPLAQTLKMPIIRIDDITRDVPPNAGMDFWDQQITTMLNIIEAHLEMGISVIADSVFMADDRYHAQALACKHQAMFRPIYTFVSDVPIWKKRVTERFNQLNNDAVATWESLQHQRRHFLEWDSGTALFVDTADPFEENFAKVLEFVTQDTVNLKLLSTDVPLMKGKYHSTFQPSNVSTVLEKNADTNSC